MANARKLSLEERAERLRLDAAMLACLRPYQLQNLRTVFLADIRREADEYEVARATV